MLNRLKSQKPFLYEDSKGIIAISGDAVVEVPHDIDSIVPTLKLWFERYKNIIIGNEDREHISNVIREVSNNASLLTKGYLNDEGKLTLLPGVCPNKIEKYWDGLTIKEKENFEKQLNRLKELRRFYKITD